MAQYIAKEGIVVVRNGKFVYPEIGKVFPFTEKEIADLIRIRPQSIEEVKAPEQAAPSVVEQPAPETPVEGDDEADVDLSELTKAKLVAKAKSLGLSVASNASKGDLIAAIEAAQADDDEQL